MGTFRGCEAATSLVIRFWAVWHMLQDSNFHTWFSAEIILRLMAMGAGGEVDRR